MSQPVTDPLEHNGGYGNLTRIVDGVKRVFVKRRRDGRLILVDPPKQKHDFEPKIKLRVKKIIRVPITKIKEFFKHLKVSQPGSTDVEAVVVEQLPNTEPKVCSRLLSLPRELRDQIWHEVIHNPSGGFYNANSMRVEGIHSSIMSVCRQTYLEVPNPIMANEFRVCVDLFPPREMEMRHFDRFTNPIHERLFVFASDYPSIKIRLTVTARLDVLADPRRSIVYLEWMKRVVKQARRLPRNIEVQRKFSKTWLPNVLVSIQASLLQQTPLSGYNGGWRQERNPLDYIAQAPEWTEELERRAVSDMAALHRRVAVLVRFHNRLQYIAIPEAFGFGIGF
ncbi:MAG: hypothetical protein M1819_002930 [Sarea resinae]|nr:MAG: hypothetical protein M1819_002930 [Sarea resinae]